MVRKKLINETEGAALLRKLIISDAATLVCSFLIIRFNLLVFHLAGPIFGVLTCVCIVEHDGMPTLAEEVDLAIPSQLGS